jgi:hypothetical protein
MFVHVDDVVIAMRGGGHDLLVARSHVRARGPVTVASAEAERQQRDCSISCSHAA